MADFTVSTDIDTLLQSGSNAAARINLGLGSAATTESSAYATSAQGTLANSALQNGDTFDELIDGTTNKAFTDTEQTKLAGIAAGAEVNTINTALAGEPTGSDLVLNAVSLTQAEYDAGTPVATTFYIIT
mgnify:CR=1 FL=1